MTHTDKLPFIGLTGGIGAGKSRIIDFIENSYKAKILKADDVAKDLMKKGTEVYKKIVEYFLDYDILDDEGELDSRKISAIVFRDKEKLLGLNQIVHPSVKSFIVKSYKEECERKRYDYFFLEAALLIEDGYDKICDELWYIYASEETRRKRLKESRKYSDDKITEIFASQLSEEVFREKCSVVINNDGDFEVCEKEIRDSIDKLWELS
jgi:dephospho-CoA kinase